MPEKKWYRRWWVRIIGVILLLFFSFAVYLALVAIEYPPDIADRSAELLNRERTSGGDYRIGASRCENLHLDSMNCMWKALTSNGA